MVAVENLSRRVSPDNACPESSNFCPNTDGNHASFAFPDTMRNSQKCACSQDSNKTRSGSEMQEVCVRYILRSSNVIADKCGIWSFVDSCGNPPSQRDNASRKKRSTHTVCTHRAYSNNPGDKFCGTTGSHFQHQLHIRAYLQDTTHCRR